MVVMNNARTLTLDEANEAEDMDHTSIAEKIPAASDESPMENGGSHMSNHITKGKNDKVTIEVDVVMALRTDNGAVM